MTDTNDKRRTELRALFRLLTNALTLVPPGSPAQKAFAESRDHVERLGIEAHYGEEVWRKAVQGVARCKCGHLRKEHHYIKRAHGNGFRHHHGSCHVCPFGKCVVYEVGVSDGS